MECKHLSVLTVVFLLYLCLGAAIFQATERGIEKDNIAEMIKEYRNFLGNHTCVSGKDLTSFLEAVLDKVGPYGGLSRAQFDSNLTKSLTRARWDFPGAFTFSVTVITTIGYGHIFPVSPLGRILCVVYALVGIPLTLIVLSGIGDQLNNIGRRIMSLKLCFESPAVNKALNMVGVVLAGVVVMFVIPTIVFVIVEGWDILKGLYYCFITLSTIGFGDYVAGNGDNIENETSRNIYRIVVYLWILVGLAYISLIIKSISDLFVKKAEVVKKGAKRATTHLATLNSVSAIASFTQAIASSNSDVNRPDSAQPGDGATSGPGPTMTYRKRGLKRLLMKSGDSASFDKDDGGVHLVSVSVNNANINTDVNSNRRDPENSGSDSRNKHNQISKEGTTPTTEVHIENKKTENEVENTL